MANEDVASPEFQPAEDHQISRWTTLGIGAVGVSLIAAPVAIPMAVTALGFGSAGIAAGTAASSFMASYGGVVGAGSVCSVLQAIGATGAIGAGTTVASVGGAVTGTAVVLDKSSAIKHGAVSAADAVKKASSSTLAMVGGASQAAATSVGQVSYRALSKVGGASQAAATTAGQASCSALASAGAWSKGVAKAICRL